MRDGSGVELLEGLDDEGVCALLEDLGEAAVLPVWETTKVVRRCLDDTRTLVGKLKEGLHEQDVPEGRLPLLRVLVGVGVLRIRLDDHPGREEVVVVVVVDGLRRLPDESFVLPAVVVARRVEDVVNAHLDQLGADRDCVLERLRRSSGLCWEEHVGNDSVVTVLLQKLHRLGERGGEIHRAAEQLSAVLPSVVQVLLGVFND